jgi:hypothetical protein
MGLAFGCSNLRRKQPTASIDRSIDRRRRNNSPLFLRPLLVVVCMTVTSAGEEEEELWVALRTITYA